MNSTTAPVVACLPPTIRKCSGNHKLKAGRVLDVPFVGRQKWPFASKLSWKVWNGNQIAVQPSFLYFPSVAIRLLCGHRGNKWNISDNGKLWWQEWNTLLWLFPPSSSVTTLDTNYRPLHTDTPYPQCRLDMKLIWYASLAASLRYFRTPGILFQRRGAERQCHFVQTQHHQCKLKIYYSGRKFPSYRYVDG